MSGTTVPVEVANVLEVAEYHRLLAAEGGGHLSARSCPHGHQETLHSQFKILTTAEQISTNSGYPTSKTFSSFILIIGTKEYNPVSSVLTVPGTVSNIKYSDN
jgi:hypothetical protein